MHNTYTFCVHARVTALCIYVCVVGCMDVAAVRLAAVVAVAKKKKPYTPLLLCALQRRRRQTRLLYFILTAACDGQRGRDIRFDELYGWDGDGELNEWKKIPSAVPPSLPSLLHRPSTPSATPLPSHSGRIDGWARVCATGALFWIFVLLGIGTRFFFLNLTVNRCLQLSRWLLRTVIIYYDT